MRAIMLVRVRQDLDTGYRVLFIIYLATGLVTLDVRFFAITILKHELT